MHNLTPTFAAVAAFYGDPLPHERQDRGYVETVALAKIAALQTVLGRSECIRYMPSRQPAVAPRKVAARKRSMTAEQFFDAFQAARRAVAADIGDRWVILGYARWATVPNGLRSFKGPRGGKVSLPRDIRIPPAKYWPGGVVPPELVMVEPSKVMTLWVEHNGALMHPMLVNLALAHAEQRVVDEANREGKLRRSWIADAKRSLLRKLAHARDCATGGSLGGAAIWLSEAAELRRELAADLRRYRETGSFTDPPEELDEAA